MSKKRRNFDTMLISNLDSTFEYEEDALLFGISILEKKIDRANEVITEYSKKIKLGG